jgi:hypothetical protein
VRGNAGLVDNHRLSPIPTFSRREKALVASNSLPNLRPQQPQWPAVGNYQYKYNLAYASGFFGKKLLSKIQAHDLENMLKTIPIARNKSASGKR